MTTQTNKQTESQVNVAKFICFLNRFLPFIDFKIPTEINSGGCGKFALMLAKKLTECFPSISYQLYACFDPDDIRDDDNKLHVDNFLNGKESAKGQKETHVMIMIEGFLFDSEGIHDGTGELLLMNSLKMNLSQLQLLCEQGDWSDIFDESCIPDIQRMLDILPEEFVEFLSDPDKNYLQKYVHHIPCDNPNHHHVGLKKKYNNYTAQKRKERAEEEQMMRQASIPWMGGSLDDILKSFEKKRKRTKNDNEDN